MGAGATYSGTAGAWTGTANIFSATGAVQIVATNGATWYVTGVQLEKGSTATSFDYRPYGTELALCQRYYLASSTVNYHAGLYSGVTYVGQVELKVSMRSSPTVTLLSGGGGFAFANSDPLHFYFTGTGGTFITNWNATAEL
jgi:hypothetical protein